jgi:hypothetical protein
VKGNVENVSSTVTTTRVIKRENTKYTFSGEEIIGTEHTTDSLRATGGNSTYRSVPHQSQKNEHKQVA